MTWTQSVLFIPNTSDTVTVLSLATVWIISAQCAERHVIFALGKKSVLATVGFSCFLCMYEEESPFVPKRETKTLIPDGPTPKPTPDGLTPKPTPDMLDSFAWSC